MAFSEIIGNIVERVFPKSEAATNRREWREGGERMRRILREVGWNIRHEEPRRNG